MVDVRSRIDKRRGCWIRVPTRTHGLHSRRFPLFCLARVDDLKMVLNMEDDGRGNCSDGRPVEGIGCSLRPLHNCLSSLHCLTSLRCLVLLYGGRRSAFGLFLLLLFHTWFRLLVVSVRLLLLLTHS